MNDAGAWMQTGSVREDQFSARRSEDYLSVVLICGIRVHRVAMAEAVSLVESAIERGRALSIGMINAAKIVSMRKDDLLRRSVESCDLVLADGAPIVWLSRLKGTPLPERVAGIDLMFALFELANRRKLRVYLFGATSSTIERVAEIARRDYPGMILSGYRDGYFSSEEAPRIAEAIRFSKAQLLFVAMPSPKKETFMNNWGAMMGVNVCHGVGGSFDVMAGVTRRAPRWMQRAGLEWLYRVYQEPRRMWKRYLVTNLMFGWLAAKDLLLRRKSS